MSTTQARVEILTPEQWAEAQVRETNPRVLAAQQERLNADIFIVDGPLQAQEAVNAAGQIMDAIDATKAHYEPMVKAAQNALDAIRSQRAKELTPLEEAKKTLNDRVAAWRSAEAARLEAEARQRQIEAQRKHEEEVESLVEALEAEGTDAAAITEVIKQSARVVPVAPVLAPAKISGFVPREKWTGEVENDLDLLHHIVDNPSDIGLLKWNQSALDAKAKAIKNVVKIPGLRVRREEVGSSRRK